MTKQNFWSRWRLLTVFRCQSAFAAAIHASGGFARLTLAAMLVALVPICVLLIRSALHADENLITVNTVSDTSKSDDGLCSLREAINNANSPGVDTTGGDCGVGSGADVIHFTVSGTITLGST